MVIASAGVGVFLSTSSPSKSSTTTSSSLLSDTSQSAGSNTSGPFKVNYNTLVVGYNSGLWSLQVQATGGKTIKEMTAVLHTPTQSEMCTGLGGGFSFFNCPATPPSSGSFPANATFTGFASGVGAGSAQAGKTYDVTLDVIYLDGTTLNQTTSLTASSSG